MKKENQEVGWLHHRGGADPKREQHSCHDPTTQDLQLNGKAFAFEVGSGVKDNFWFTQV